MIKVPATPEGIPAIRQLISEGINVNVTLLFAQAAYEQVAEALHSRAWRSARPAGRTSSNIASVASFFVSRIDTAVDALLSAKIKTSTDAGERARLTGLLGKVAIANAKLTYQRYREIFGSRAGSSLRRAARRAQRLLWASTSTKNPSYRDVIYVEELIGADTVNTIPPATFNAFRDHGESAQEPDRRSGRRRRRHGRAGQGRHFHEGGHRQAAGRWRSAVRHRLRSTAQVHRPAAGTRESVKINRQTFKMPADLRQRGQRHHR